MYEMARDLFYSPVVLLHHNHPREQRLLVPFLQCFFFCRFGVENNFALLTYSQVMLLAWSRNHILSRIDFSFIFIFSFFFFFNRFPTCLSFTYHLSMFSMCSCLLSSCRKNWAFSSCFFRRRLCLQASDFIFSNHTARFDPEPGLEFLVLSDSAFKFWT